jgi:hypothetical protein
MDIEYLLNEEIKNELDDLRAMEVGTDEHKKAVDDITRLMDRAIELEKINIQERDNSEKRKEAKALEAVEQDWKRLQMEEERKDRFVKNCVAVAGVVVPSVITIWGTLKSFEFEKEGTITTSIGRGFINKLIPKK